jgi:hypothetical protein
VQCLHAALHTNVKPEVNLTEVRLKIIAADVVEYAASPVFQVEDVLMQRLEIRLLSTDLCSVPSS